jgi:hypothetical protein
VGPFARSSADSFNEVTLSSCSCAYSKALRNRITPCGWLYRLLDEAEADVAAGDRGIGVKALRKQLGR